MHQSNLSKTLLMRFGCCLLLAGDPLLCSAEARPGDTALKSQGSVTDAAIETAQIESGYNESDAAGPGRSRDLQYFGTVSSGCSVQTSAHGSSLTSPVLAVAGRQLDVVDTDGDGIVRATDINAVILTAHEAYKNTGRIVRVIFDASKIKYETMQSKRILLDQKIIIRSGVVVDARQHDFFVRNDSRIENLFEFEPGTTSAALIGASIHSGNTPSHANVVSSLIRIYPPAQNIHIIDNELYGETGAYKDDLGEGTNIWGLWLPAEGSRIFVYGNVFKWTPTGIVMSARGLSNVEIVSNEFENWRRRAIIGIANGDAALSDVVISHNTIAPPTATDVSKQPIAFQAVTGGSRAVTVSFNKIQGSGEAHERATVSTGTADNISVHSTSEFKISRNCIDASGELGINVSMGSYDGIVDHNEVTNSDLTGINVQSNTDAANAVGYYECAYTDLTHSILIEHNIVKNNGKNRLDIRLDSVSEIYVWKAHDVHVEHNTIIHRDGSVITAGIRSVCGKGISIKNNSYSLKGGVPELNLRAQPPR